MFSRTVLWQRIFCGVAVASISFVTMFAGCDQTREEKVLDVEAPGVDIEVNKVEGKDGVEKIDIEAGSTEK